MPKPILYYILRSPASRAVLLTAPALRVNLDLRPLYLTEGDHLTAEFLKLHPLHTMPVLNDDCIIVMDSHVICSYLADKYTVDETLYPQTTNKRLQVDAFLYYNCGQLLPRISFMIDPVLYGDASIVVSVQKAFALCG